MYLQIGLIFEMKKKISLFVMAAFYLLAGINHFRTPETYYQIIPAYFSNPHSINIEAGIAEILLAILLLISTTKKISCYAIIIMLLAFIPAHIYMLKVGFCIKDLCLPTWALWARLIILQPLLILWAWSNIK